MSAQIIHPRGLPYNSKSTPSNSLDSLPGVSPNPDFFSLPYFDNETWSPSNTLHTTPSLPSWANKPEPEQPSPSLCIDPALQPPQTNLRKNRRKSSSPTDTNVHTPESKREHFLARNRLAASKCRQKKKQQHEELEAQFEEASARNQRLQSQVEYLRDQVLQLKDEILRHAGCNDVHISAHLARMVEQVTRRSPFYDHQGAFPTTMSSMTRTMSTPSTTMSTTATVSSTSPSQTNSSTVADSPLMQGVLENEKLSEWWHTTRELTDDEFKDLINFD